MMSQNDSTAKTTCSRSRQNARRQIRYSIELDTGMEQRAGAGTMVHMRFALNHRRREPKRKPDRKRKQSSHQLTNKGHIKIKHAVLLCTYKYIKYI